jgi:hypothetical protein
VREITVDEWRAGYFVVRPNMWRMLVREKAWPRVVVHCDYEVVEVKTEQGHVTVKEPDEVVLEGKT